MNGDTARLVWLVYHGYSVGECSKGYGLMDGGSWLRPTVWYDDWRLLIDHYMKMESK